jgi:Kef-type K+ transport system membrane component KefB
MIEVMQGTFAEIGMIMAVAVAVAGIMHALKQPLIIAYIITGLIVGPYFLDLIQSKETFEVFSSIGVALLLFIIGLGLNPQGSEGRR